MRWIYVLTFVLFTLISNAQNQMKMWQMDTFKKAEKARKWRVGRSGNRLKTKKKKSWFRRKQYTYGQPTTIRHKGLR